MYTIDTGTDQLLAIDRNNLTATVVGPLGFDAGVLDMDFVGATGELYVAARNNLAQRSELRIVDIDTGASTLVGVIPVDYVTGFSIENEVVCSP
jgi:hypothetical protein